MLPFSTSNDTDKRDEQKKTRRLINRASTVMILLALTVVALVGTRSMSGNASASSREKMMHIMGKKTAKHVETIEGKTMDDSQFDTSPDQTSSCGSHRFTLARGGSRDFNIPLNVPDITIDLCGSTTDTVVRILRNGNQIGVCDDGGSNLGGCQYCGFRNERWRLGGLLQGTQYTVRVQPYRLGGNVVLNLQCGAVTPTTTTTTTTTTSTATPGSTSTTTTTSSAPNPGCRGPRVRKDWMHMTQQERNLFIDGFKALRANGKLARFTLTHASTISFRIAHNVDLFLPWHRYFLWELESQIRALGGRFSCFALPYWDWTRQSGNEVNNPLFTQGLGGNGGSNGCVQTGQFRQGQYVTTYGNCLRRNMCGSAGRPAFQCTFLPFETSQSLVTGIINLDTYTRFRPYLEGPNHNEAHNFFGGDLLGSASPDDPFFYLLHTNVDHAWALWQDCHNYENLPRNSQTSSVVGNVQLDTGMIYDGQNGLSTASWARLSTTAVTARDVQNIQGGFMNYKYETSILQRSGVPFGRCSFMGGSSAWIGQVPPVLQGMPRDEREFVARELDFHAALLARALDGDESAAIAVGVDAQIGYGLTHKEKRVLISDYSCKKSVELEHANGGPPPCVFDPKAVAHCGQGPNPLQITLAELKAKAGVAGNACLMRIREEMYGMCKMLGTLRDLCNGYYDVSKECNYQEIELKGKEKEKYHEEEKAIKKKLKKAKKSGGGRRKNNYGKKRRRKNRRNKKKKNKNAKGYGKKGKSSKEEEEAEAEELNLENLGGNDIDE